jgi:capsular exopolysaccharide synthesis family protein
MSTEIALLQSKSLALRVAKELDLDKDPKFLQQGAISLLLERLGLSGREESDEAGQSKAGPEQPSATSDTVRPERPSAALDAAGPEQPSAALDEAAEALRQRIQVERLGLAYVLSISIKTRDPTLSQRIGDAVAKNFFAEAREARSDARARAADWLTKWVAELRDSLSQTEGEIEKIKAESGLSDIGLAVNVTEQQMSELNKLLATARAQVLEKKLRLDQARHMLESSADIQAIPDLMMSEQMTRLRQQQSELRSREAELSGKLGDRHVEVLAVRAQLAIVNRQMNYESQHIVNNLQSTYELALDRQHSLEGSLQKITASVTDNSSAYVKLRALQPAADAKRKLFEQALGDLDELARRSASDDEGGRVVAPASLPRPASALFSVIIYGAAGIFGTGLGALIAFLIEHLQSSFKTHAMVERDLGYPVLAMIPVVRRRFRRVSSDELAEGLLCERRSQLSTSVETARIVLRFSAGGEAPKVILLTSAMPGEGKSAVARLIATSSALSGRRTAVVDCDLHRGSLSKQFGKRQAGLAQVLDGETDIASVTVQDPATGLFVIPAGFTSKSPADLLSSEAMRELGALLRLQYDYVVLDASPLLPVIDALALAAIADKIVLIVEWGRTSRTSVSEALKTLRLARYSVGGIVLNKVDYKQLASYGYGFGRDYVYGSRFRAMGKH